ncbi:hypothetical protein HQ865_21860 [Mucilaginibacter mali]|uniref:DUF5723 domain-containing protein n=1 Tax=Mucilaginibacter mali TaxID=2740462 RepID=A0A7D4TQ27_9SPHI|nr:hypothetical protein [Mucilaginibacter mali]QKJ32293.1 hypothetical protein HQ865_21860 [Mucilaginibacter mali]
MKKHIITYILSLATITAFAQQTMDHAHHMDMKKDTTHHQMKMSMSSQYSIDLPMNRDGSGTSWLPDESPMLSYMKHGKNGWMSMLHYNQFVRYNMQDVFKSGSRGGNHFDAPNMIMGMTQKRIGNGIFGINAMLSFDPFLVGNAGYPLLYQTGESYKGNKLVDRQHPHDLFAELAVSYAQHLGNNTDAFISVGYPGEPALGPPVFMHRLSGMSNPDAPLTHHYADATHITFGVTTLGFRYKDVKLEGSVFTGREPDEHRYDFDPAKFDSYAVRLSYNPSNQWALQVSNGWIHSPEDLEPQQNVDRFTASAIHTKMLNSDSYVATTLVYGQNHYSDNGKALPSILLESTLQLTKTAIYGRYEYVRKDAEELDLHAMFPANPNFDINALTIGTNRIISTFKNTDLRVGLQGSLYASPSALKGLYGSVPLAFQFYLRISPAMLKMGGGKAKMKKMDMGGMEM